MAKAIDPSTVVYLAPETLDQDALSEKLLAASTQEEVVAILNSRPTVGEYRQYLGDEVVPGADGCSVLAPKYGDLVVWVQDDAEDSEDPAGHYEVYGGNDDDYIPQGA